MLLRGAYLRDVGAFDERLFLYYEDLELSLRGSARGWRYRYEPASVVEHRVGSSTVGGGAEARAERRKERNRLLVLARHPSPSTSLAAQLRPVRGRHPGLRPPGDRGPAAAGGAAVRLVAEGAGPRASSSALPRLPGHAGPAAAGIAGEPGNPGPFPIVDRFDRVFHPDRPHEEPPMPSFRELLAATKAEIREIDTAEAATARRRPGP